MEATVKGERGLEGEKAQRIIQAMRASVAERGAAGATFDHVASAAGVSRGLLHYYFGTKERLLVEVVRKDCDIQMERLERQLAAADSVDAIVAALVAHLEDFLEHDPAQFGLIFELFTASRHNEDLREAMKELYHVVRSHVAGALREKEAAGVVELRGDAESVASVLFALGDGIALQVLSDPDWDSSGAFATGIGAARHMLGARD